MDKILLYGYPPFVLLSLVQACATKEQLADWGINPFCPGLLLMLGILLLPVWVLAVAVCVNEAAADDDIFGDYSVDIHIGRRGKRYDSD